MKDVQKIEAGWVDGSRKEICVIVTTGPGEYAEYRLTAEQARDIAQKLYGYSVEVARIAGPLTKGSVREEI